MALDACRRVDVRDPSLYIISLISYPRVGPRALLGTFHLITLLYALSHFYTHYDKAPLITLISQASHKVYNLIKRVRKYYLSAVLRQKEDTLFTIMHHYDTIIDIIDLIHIIT
jgi:hypothetical protein